MKILEDPAPSETWSRQVTAVTRATLQPDRIFMETVHALAEALRTMRMLEDDTRVSRLHEMETRHRGAWATPGTWTNCS